MPEDTTGQFPPVGRENFSLDIRAPEPRLGLVGSANNRPEPGLVNRLVSICLSLPRLHDKGSGGGGGCGQARRWRVAAGGRGVSGRASSTGKGKQRPVQDGNRLGHFVLDRFTWSERGATTVPFLQDDDCCGADVENPKEPRQAVLYLQESGLGELFSFHFFVVHFGLLKS